MITPTIEQLKTLEVFLFDEAGGEYAGPYVAQESPLEPDVYIEPTSSTRLPPPFVGVNEVAVFRAGAWSVTPDYRKSKLYSTADASSRAVDAIGPLPAGVTDKPRPSKSHAWQGGDWVVDLTSLKQEVWEAIKSERDRRIQHGGYKVGAKWFHSDTFSRTQQMGLVMLGANIPANTPWKTMDGSFVVMTQALAGQIFAAAAASDIAIFGAAETHRAAMEASADPAAYDFAGGWPVGFGE